MKYLLSFIFLINVNLHAQLITDRPNQTESPNSVQMGTFQVETGAGVSYESTKTKANRQIVLPNALFRYGISDFVELRIITNHLINNNNDNTQSGFANTEIGAKFEIWNSDDDSSTFGMLNHLVLPNGNEAFTSNSYGTVNRLAYSKNINSRFSVGANVGYQYFGTDEGDILYTLSFGIAVSDRLSLFVESYGFVLALQQNQLSADAGLLYLINDNLQWDVTIGTGIDRTMNFINTGISWRVPFSAN
jgi:hypothetical protein